MTTPERRALRHRPLRAFARTVSGIAAMLRDVVVNTRAVLDVAAAELELLARKAP